MSSDFLTHYGIPGMKWGKRSASSVRGKKAVGPISADAAEANNAKVKIKKSGTNSLSNKELQSVVTRINLEQQYSKLSPSKMQRGKKITNKLLIGAGNKTVEAVVNKGISAGMKAVFK